VSERAGELAHATSRYARRTRKAGARFVSGNALPLSLIGAGLGWLVWNNMRSDTRAERPSVQPAHARRSRMPTLLNERSVPHTGAPTTTGEKLIGVRTGEVHRDE
jgi:hypothetical protein